MSNYFWFITFQNVLSNHQIKKWWLQRKLIEFILIEDEMDPTHPKKKDS